MVSLGPCDFLFLCHIPKSIESRALFCVSFSNLDLYRHVEDDEMPLGPSNTNVSNPFLTFMMINKAG